MVFFFVSRETYIEQEQGENSHDRNDRAIRTAVKWYNEHLKNLPGDGKIHVILLTNDRKNKERAVEEGIMAYTCKAYGLNERLALAASKLLQNCKCSLNGLAYDFIM